MRRCPRLPLPPAPLRFKNNGPNHLGFPGCAAAPACLCPPAPLKAGTGDGPAVHYKISWVKWSTVYYAAELLLRLKAWRDGSACIGCMSARGPESAQFIGRKVVHQCRSQVATGRLHRCAILRHMELTTAGWSVDRLKQWTADGKKKFEKRFEKSRAVMAAAKAALSHTWPAGVVSAWKTYYDKSDSLESDALESDTDSVVPTFLDSAQDGRDDGMDISTTEGVGPDGEERLADDGGGEEEVTDQDEGPGE